MAQRVSTPQGYIATGSQASEFLAGACCGVLQIMLCNYSKLYMCRCARAMRRGLPSGWPKGAGYPEGEPNTAGALLLC